jgi:hypothetical protein
LKHILGNWFDIQLSESKLMMDLYNQMTTAAGRGKNVGGRHYQIDTGTGEHNYLNSPRIYLQKHSPRRWSWMMAWRSEEAMLSVGQFMVGNSLHGQVVDQIITGWQRNRTDIPSRSQQMVVPIATRAHK